MNFKLISLFVSMSSFMVLAAHADPRWTSSCQAAFNAISCSNPNGQLLVRQAAGLCQNISNPASAQAITEFAQASQACNDNVNNMPQTVQSMLAIRSPDQVACLETLEQGNCTFTSGSFQRVNVCMLPYSQYGLQQLQSYLANNNCGNALDSDLKHALNSVQPVQAPQTSNCQSILQSAIQVCQQANLQSACVSLLQSAQQSCN